MASWDDVRSIALSLPEATEQSSYGSNQAWSVRGKAFAWERPLRQSDLKALGAQAPKGPILCTRTEHVGVKEALLASDPEVFFTTPHFNGYPAILIRLERITLDDLRDVIIDAWLAQAPKRLAKEYLSQVSR